MNKIFLLIFLACAVCGGLHAEEADTLRVVDIEEVVVIASPKENLKLREQPASSTILSQQEMQAAQVQSIKQLTGVVPNLFIPDYGSRLTTAVYIRGVGSRINTPSVGLYVDNIPYIDKSAFDFSYADVERIDVLRGPQGTLYGRNAMGGLIKVHTKSPFTYQGTDLRLGAGTYNAYKASVTHYHRISEHFAFSAGGFYDYQGGFFRNSFRNGERVDRSRSAGGRMRAIWLPGSNWKVDVTLNYEYGDQGGYPYQYLGALDPATQPEELALYIGKIANDEQGSYRRSLLNGGLNLEYQAQCFTLSAVTGYQHLRDRMFLDQDFSPNNLFNITQKQRMHTLSEEIVLKSKPGRRWQWTTGAFGFYQWLHTDGPVDFHRQGITDVIEGNVNTVFDGLSAQGAPSMHLSINNESLYIGGNFDTPTLSAALFHQSTLNDLLGVEGLSATVGLRLDYEKMWMDYRSVSDPAVFAFRMTVNMPGMPFPITVENAAPLRASTSYIGSRSTDYVQLLPKFALRYEWAAGNNVYLSAARGYRSGGYNIQMFSDLATSALRNAMMDAIAADDNFSRYAQMIAQMKVADPDVDAATRYRPEYAWSYEAGAHLTLADGRLQADVSAFVMDTRDQQISRFSDQGLGRVTVNAGRSRSLGMEAALRAALTDHLTLSAGYGYTHATFTNYRTGDEADADYNGHFVPFVPRHTLNAALACVFPLSPSAWLDDIRLDVNCTGAGRIYWTEQNMASQPFYATLNGRVSFRRGAVQADLWLRNALNTDYTAFYFESLGNAFRQQGRLLQAGVELRIRF